MSNSITNSLCYSLNQTEQKKGVTDEVQNSIDTTYSDVTSALTTLKNVGSKIFTILTDAFIDYHQNGGTDLKKKNIIPIPTSVEKQIGVQFFDKICPEDQIDTESDRSKLVQEIGREIIRQSDRKDLDLEIIVKKDENESNAYVIPGGKIVVTQGMLNELAKDSLTSGDLKNKIASLLSYLVAKASLSAEVKEATNRGIHSIITKIVSFVKGFFFPSVRRRQTPEEKKKAAVGRLVELSVDLGGKVILHNQKAEAEKEAKELALKYAAGAGLKIDEDDLEDTLELILADDDAERFEEEVETDLGRIIPNVAKLIAS